MMTPEMEAFKNKERYTLADVAALVKMLRSENGCAWDREQTHESVRNALIEETYECVEGIDTADASLLREELGDVLFQVFFHAEIEREKGVFDIDDICDELCKKMVLRHPHVFGDVVVSGSADVLKNWDAIKAVEKSRDTVGKQLESVPETLPSLMRAEKLLSRYKKNGGNVEKDTAVLIERVKEAANDLDGEKLDEKAVGSLLFAVANLTYAAKINAEQALYDTNKQFVKDHSHT